MTNNVIDAYSRGLRPGGGPPYDGDMEARITRLEALTEKTSDRLGGIETRLTKLETRSETFATKADVADAKGAIIMWVVGAIFIAQILPLVPKIVQAFSP